MKFNNKALRKEQENQPKALQRNRAKYHLVLSRSYLSLVGSLAKGSKPSSITDGFGKKTKVDDDKYTYADHTHQESLEGRCRTQAGGKRMAQTFG